MEQRNRGQRAGLSRAAVLVAARRLVAERGLGALSMRALAGELGVAPNALYSHVASKTELVDALLDDVLAEVLVPASVGSAGDREGRGDPVAGLRALMVSTYDVLLAHPDLVPLYLARQGARGPHAQHLGAVMTGLLAEAGVAGTTARDALRVLVVHAIGLAAFGSGPQAGGSLTAEDLRATFLAGLEWLLAGITDARPAEGAMTSLTRRD